WTKCPSVNWLFTYWESYNTIDSGYYITINVKPYLLSNLYCAAQGYYLNAPNRRMPQKHFYCCKKTLHYPMHQRTVYIGLDEKQYYNVIKLQFINTKSELASMPINIPW